MLKDILTHNLDIVFCGTAKGKISVLKGFYYAGPGNKFYNILHKTGFTPFKLEPKDCYEINKYKIGLTDLVHNEYGNDNEISSDNFDVEGFLKKMKFYKPKFIAFNSKKGASFVLGYGGKTNLFDYGLQKKTIGKSKVYVLPSTSGNARKYWNESYWHKLKKLVDKES